MIARIVNIVLIPAAMFGLQRKTPLIGDYLADARLAVLDLSHKEIKAQMKAKNIDDAAARVALTSIRSLRKVNDHGWASEDEYVQLVQVLTLVSKSGATTALAAVNGQLTGIREVADKWIRLGYDELSSGVGRTYEELKKLFKTKK